jgi:hypothetical protein
MRRPTLASSWRSSNPLAYVRGLIRTPHIHPPQVHQLPPIALGRRYIDGVVGISGKSDAWIITSGFDAGASGLTGKASMRLKQETGNRTDTNM